MPNTPSVITTAQLTRFLRYDPADNDLGDEDTAQAEEMAVGWLSEPTGVEDWRTVSPLPPTIRTWILELAGIAIENPTSMQDDQSGDTRSGWRDRRQQIIEAARAWSRRQGHQPKPTLSGAARGSFPPAGSWPDPALPTRRRRW